MRGWTRGHCWGCYLVGLLLVMAVEEEKEFACEELEELEAH